MSSKLYDTYRIKDCELYNENTNCECSRRRGNLWSNIQQGECLDQKNDNSYYTNVGKSTYSPRDLWKSRKTRDGSSHNHDNMNDRPSNTKNSRKRRCIENQQNDMRNDILSTRNSYDNNGYYFENLECINFERKKSMGNEVKGERSTHSTFKGDYDEDTPKRNSLKSRFIATAFQEFLTNELSIAGVRYAVTQNASFLRRGIWLVLVILGFTFMTFQFYDRINFYIRNPTVVDITINHKHNIDFPTVTICNENIIDLNKAKGIPHFIDLVHNMYPPFPDPSFKPDFQKTQDVFDEIEKEMNLTWDELWLSLSPAVQQNLILQCSFNDHKCDLEDFKIVATDMGHCLQFNGANQAYSSTRAGSTYGLSLILKAVQANYLYSKSRGAGFRILLHSKNDLPSVQELGSKASVGFVTSVAMRFKTVTQLQKPFGNCSDVEDYFFTSCASACLHDYVIKKCGCKYYYYTGTDTRSCNPEEMYVCADNATSEFIAEHLLNEICDCPPQCQVHQYQYRLSSAIYSNIAVAGILELTCLYFNATCDDDDNARVQSWNRIVRDDICELEIFFDEMVHEEVKTKRAYTILALLCDIGGALGLILGSTVLTLFEIFDFIIVLAYKYVFFHRT